MFSFINRVVNNFLSIFKMNKEQNEKCKKCSIIKRGGISPAVIYTDRNIDHDDCDINCGMDHKFTFIIFRLVFIGLVLYVLYRYGIIVIEGILYYFS